MKVSDPPIPIQGTGRERQRTKTRDQVRAEGAVEQRRIQKDQSGHWAKGLNRICFVSSLMKIRCISLGSMDHGSNATSLSCQEVQGKKKKPQKKQSLCHMYLLLVASPVGTLQLLVQKIQAELIDGRLEEIIFHQARRETKQQVSNQHDHHINLLGLS